MSHAGRKDQDAQASAKTNTARTANGPTHTGVVFVRIEGLAEMHPTLLLAPPLGDQVVAHLTAKEHSKENCVEILDTDALTAMHGFAQGTVHET